MHDTNRKMVMTLDAQMPLGGAGSGLCHGTSWDSAWFGGDALPGVADCVGDVASEDAGRLSLDEAGELEVRNCLGSGVRKPTGGALRGASFSKRDRTLLSDRREALSLEPFTYPERHRSIYIFFKLARHCSCSLWASANATISFNKSIESTSNHP